MKKEVVVFTELRNVAQRFSKAEWREYEVNKVYASVKDAAKVHNLKNCKYSIYLDDVEVRAVNNARLTAYGVRY